MTHADRIATAEIDLLVARHPDVVPAIIDATLAASPLAGPQRILAEIQTLYPEVNETPDDYEDGCPDCGRDIDRLGGNPDCETCAAEPAIPETEQRLLHGDR